MSGSVSGAGERMGDVERTAESDARPDCRCPMPKPTGRGTCGTCERFACEYADRGQTRCPSWRCDCFIETHPFDNPQGLHPEAFIVTRPTPAGGGHDFRDRFCRERAGGGVEWRPGYRCPICQPTRVTPPERPSDD